MVKRYEATERRHVYIKEWLEHLNVSQQELADQMGTDKGNVSRWISEQWRITVDVLSGFSVALSVPVHYLFLPPRVAEAQRRALSAVADARTALE